LQTTVSGRREPPKVEKANARKKNPCCSGSSQLDPDANAGELESELVDDRVESVEGGLG
jgi:hypothetical protein